MYIIFGHNNCVWCTASKEELSRRGFSYKFINIYEDATQFKYYFPHAKSVPQIMVEDGHSIVDGGGGYILIGGYTDLMKHLT